MTTMVNGPRPFHDRLVAQPRPTGLALAPDGTRLILSVQALDDEGTRYMSELWEVDPAGDRAPRRVPGSRQGDSAPAFAADGTLLFLADRESGECDEEPGPSLWSLTDGDAAERIAHHPGGTTAFTAAARADALACTAALLPGAKDLRTHADLLRRRRRAGVNAANRTATRTDRFRALVSHAGLWNLESFQGATDMHAYFRKIFGDPRSRRERYEADSPHLDAARLTTPMLIVHGGQDSRVPESQSRELHHDLRRQNVPTGFLYFPDESHGVEAPNHLRLLYETVLGFLDHHVLGEEWRRPELL
ncbi:MULTISPECIES: prolyl oligopeptidase family serine peptidase [Streptomyces]|nr:MULTISPECIES: prolyl oligopeptidase family serine peptidase [Streptomyces]MYT03555.1 prolyl oligopeptidase family serine peptidase [Streptomyces sp. SID5470]